jgi:hypothetical protein
MSKIKNSPKVSGTLWGGAYRDEYDEDEYGDDDDDDIYDDE